MAGCHWAKEKVGTKKKSQRENGIRRLETLRLIICNRSRPYHSVLRRRRSKVSVIYPGLSALDDDKDIIFHRIPFGSAKRAPPVFLYICVFLVLFSLLFFPLYSIPSVLRAKRNFSLSDSFDSAGKKVPQYFAPLPINFFYFLL